MKKLLFILSLILPINTNAATFIDTLGAQCGRFLYNMNIYRIPNDIRLSKLKKSTINELKICLDLYIQYGGNIPELNDRYRSAVELTKCAYEQYIKDNPILEELPNDDLSTRLQKTSQKKEIKAVEEDFFSMFIKNTPCLNYWINKDSYTKCSEITYLKTICELSTQNNENTIDTKK